MATPFSVDLDRVQGVTQRMAGFDTALETHLKQLDERIARLHHTWHGDAADAQHAAHKEWMAGAREMRAALATLKAITAAAHHNYTGAVEANSAMFDGL